MTQDLSTLLRDIERTAPPREVVSQLGTTRIDPRYNEVGAPVVSEEQLGTLYGSVTSIKHYKSEQPTHRLMLWYKLQGYNNKEIAAMMQYSEVTVGQVCRQPWFVKAFCALSTEMGKDAVNAFLDGEVLPPLERIKNLRDNGESDAVKLAAGKELLDRFLGKSVAKTESKVDASLNVSTTDVNKLQEQINRNNEILASRGITFSGAN